MITVKVHAEGINNTSTMMSLTHELELVDGLIYEIDPDEEIVTISFEDESDALPQDEILHFFLQAGIDEPEFIGKIPKEIKEIDPFS